MQAENIETKDMSFLKAAVSGLHCAEYELKIGTEYICGILSQFFFEKSANIILTIF
ncbi:hypothetical protein [Emergencia timonensis]|uniref:hypothetical protein n=1 Tax=Emergencia timonensis TaxID=1776384 RepID=UPI003994CE75